MSTNTEQQQRPYVHEMVVIHRIFRRESALLPAIVRAVGAQDRAAVERTAAAITEYLLGLHHHHAVEDLLIWPRLAERTGAATTMERMEKQHAAIDASLDAVRAALADWSGSGTSSDGETLAFALDEHRAVLVEHLDEEEEFALPEISEHLTVDEWDAVGRRGLEQVPANKRLLALGAILEDATPEERAEFLRKVPALGRIMWRLIGARQYAANCRALRAPIAAGA